MASTSECPSTPFEARRDPADRYTVHLVGELDLATRDVLAAVLDEIISPGHDLVADCAGLEFVDASGVAVLVRAASLLGGGRLLLRNVQDGPAVLFDLLKLSEAVPNLVVTVG